MQYVDQRLCSTITMLEGSRMDKVAKAKTVAVQRMYQQPLHGKA